jgi:uncharacterized protein (TIGR00369 family)
MDKDFEQWREFAMNMIPGSPHARAINMTVVELDRDHTILKVPYAPELVGDPDTGVIAGGVVTTLLDHACGHSVGAAMGKHVPVATLDLRIDYMRPAEPGLDLYAYAQCFKLTKRIAFVRAEAYERDRSDPVAAAQGAFSINLNFLKRMQGR